MLEKRYATFRKAIICSLGVVRSTFKKENPVRICPCVYSHAHKIFTLAYSTRLKDEESNECIALRDPVSRGRRANLTSL